MKNFIEVTRNNNKQLLNVNFITEITPSNDDGGCKIYMLHDKTKRVYISVDEDYNTIKEMIQKAI